MPPFQPPFQFGFQTEIALAFQGLINAAQGAGGLPATAGQQAVVQVPLAPVLVPDYPTMGLNRLASAADIIDRFIIRPQVSNRLQQVAFHDFRIRSAAAWGDRKEDAYRVIKALHCNLDFDNEGTYGTWESVSIIILDSQGYKGGNMDEEIPGGCASTQDVVTVNAFPI